MGKHKELPYEWDLYFDIKDTRELQLEYRRLLNVIEQTERKLKLMREMSQEQGLTKYLK